MMERCMDGGGCVGMWRRGEWSNEYHPIPAYNTQGIHYRSCGSLVIKTQLQHFEPFSGQLKYQSPYAVLGTGVQ